MIVWLMGSVAIALLVWISFTAWLDELPTRREMSMDAPTTPVISLPAGVAFVPSLPAPIVEALGKMQTAHATAAAKQLASEQAIGEALVAHNARVDAKKALYVAVETHWPD